MFNHITDHIAIALDRLPWRFSRTVTKAFVEAVGEEIQLIEDACLDLIFERFLQSAQGAQLDQYGSILSTPRAGLNDSDYLALLLTRVLVNRSSGETNTLLKIVSRLLGLGDSVRLIQAYPASLYFNILVPFLTPTTARRRAFVVSALQDAMAAGVGFGGVVEAQPQYFGFASDPDSLGFGEGTFATLWR